MNVGQVGDGFRTAMCAGTDLGSLFGPSAVASRLPSTATDERDRSGRPGTGRRRFFVDETIPPLGWYTATFGTYCGPTDAFGHNSDRRRRYQRLRGTLGPGRRPSRGRSPSPASPENGPSAGAYMNVGKRQLFQWAPMATGPLPRRRRVAQSPVWTGRASAAARRDRSDGSGAAQDDTANTRASVVRSRYYRETAPAFSIRYVHDAPGLSGLSR